MGRVDDRRIPREDLPQAGGPGLIVRCALPGCTHAAVLDPRPLFGARPNWPAAGETTRFRCRCGGRRAVIRHAGRPVDRYGPIDRASLALWY
ncbi:MAG: hypothetical protein EON86_03160 [Brevundimonas sp.]|nr:MAG: hypothetical protein EON86_03160 [Brevundimonas sp.]